MSELWMFSLQYDSGWSTGKRRSSSLCDHEKR